ncbi:hypothetical protein ACPXBC_30235, partial [Escherichia coli]|uniref:hypothetical protein n=1 Tax=Escherichia coli TaxID=562 RepID=UPI003CE4B9AF
LTTSPCRGAIGIDLNADHLAVCETDRFGNFQRVESLGFDLRGLSSERSAAVLGDYVAAVVALAKTAGKPIAIERLDFTAKKA